VRVFGRAHEAIPDARLVLADPHPGRDLPDWTRAPGVELRPMHGDADLMAAYREAWCTVLPAVREPFGLVLSESMACGTPVLRAAAGGIPEVIGGPPAGRVVDPEDEDGWVAALKEVLAAPPSGEDAARARARAEELSMKECVDAYEQLYANLLPGSDPFGRVVEG
jgi:glycosyltransferase involved in cell wall biosynthesis